jgi:hypothetical protein
MFEENKKKISSFIRNIDNNISKYNKQHYDFLDDRKEFMIDQEDIQEYVMEKWDLMIQEPSYRILRDKLKERLNTDNNDIDSNIKLKLCYWGEDNKHCRCADECCLVNCDNGKMWYSEDLDYHFGIEQFKYDLIVGGPKHGTIIINSNHPDNNNEEDIEIEIKAFGTSFDCIEELRHYVQDSYDKNNAIERELIIAKKKFELFKKKYKIKKIIELYDLIDPLYTQLIGYNGLSKKFSGIFISKLNDLVVQALNECDTNKDRELNDITEKLQIKSDILKEGVNTWYNISKRALKTNFTDEICHYICDYI